jgi:hypothetical protein
MSRKRIIAIVACLCALLSLGWNTRVRFGVTPCVNSSTKCHYASLYVLGWQFGITAWPNATNPSPFQSGYANINYDHRVRIYWDDSQGWKYIP